MKDVSVEYAHIYTNQPIGREHELALGVLGKLRLDLEAKNKDSSLVVMVDDYSFPDPTFNYQEFSKWLADHGHEPSLVIRESQLIPMCDGVVHNIMNKESKNKLIKYIKTNKYPCSLFIATWYLLRLGYIQSSLMPAELTAKSLINILPESFKKYEDRGIEIINDTRFSEASDKIDYIFLEGRSL